MFEGEVVSIHIAETAGAPMTALDSIRAVAGKGLEGDRYFAGTGTYSDKLGPQRQLTLIEAEAIAALAHEREISLAAGDARRNIVTTGVPLNHLVGRRFQVGDAVLQGILLCEPCDYLQKLTGKGVLSGLIHRGGLNAEVIASGTIRAGDAVRILADAAPAGSGGVVEEAAV